MYAHSRTHTIFNVSFLHYLISVSNSLDVISGYIIDLFVINMEVGLFRSGKIS